MSLAQAYGPRRLGAAPPPLLNARKLAKISVYWQKPALIRAKYSLTMDVVFRAAPHILFSHTLMVIGHRTSYIRNWKQEIANRIM